MGLGGTAKKLQKVVDIADKLYAKIGELREQIEAMRETIETTNQRVETMEGELERQRKLLEAIAEKEGIDLAEYESGETAEPSADN